MVSGDEEIINEAIEEFNEAGARKVIKLNLNSPFHTEKLNEAKNKLYSKLEKIEFNNSNCKIYKNLDAKQYQNEDNIKTILANHIVSPVYFGKTIENMISDGATTFIEIGPRKNTIRFRKKSKQRCRSL